MTSSIFHWQLIAQRLPEGTLRTRIEQAAEGWPGSLVMHINDLTSADHEAIRNANREIPRRTWATRGLQVPEVTR